MKKINELIETSLDIDIEGINEDSRLIKKNYIFVATKGYNEDHFDYIDKALEKGCVFLVVDREIDFDFPHIVVDNINNYYEELCKKFYEVDLSKLKLIGITGTDGKTTTATIVNRIVKDSAYIGTNGLTIKDKTYPLLNTTPCISELYYCFSLIQKENIKTVVMEVSSEALLHRRVDSLLFDIVAFTNITGDHLNVHMSFDNYLKCKLHLLDLVKENGFIIVNGDDSNLQKIDNDNMYSFGHNMSNSCVINSNLYIDNQMIINISFGDDNCIIKSSLFGDYNVYNIVEAFLITYYFGVSKDTILNRVEAINSINGRGERINCGQDYLIVLDYAHTIGAIKNVLDAYKDYRIITVTGCAGGRDKSKRAIIGDMVIKKSDLAILTMDDPRYENVDDIIDEMVGENSNYVRIIDREKAIIYALDMATSDSVVLILGKGRDNYMAIKDKKISYCDYNVVEKYFQNKKSSYK